jgi:hypothetical protein
MGRGENDTIDSHTRSLIGHQQRTDRRIGTEATGVESGGIVRCAQECFRVELTTGLTALGAQILRRGGPARQTVEKHHSDACRAGGNRETSPGTCIYLLHTYHVRRTGEMHTHTHAYARARARTRTHTHTFKKSVHTPERARQSIFALMSCPWHRGQLYLYVFLLTGPVTRARPPAFLPFHFLPFHSSL